MVMWHVASSWGDGRYRQVGDRVGDVARHVVVGDGRCRQVGDRVGDELVFIVAKESINKKGLISK
jgi:hypothetical protein